MVDGYYDALADDLGVGNDNDQGCEGEFVPRETRETRDAEGNAPQENVCIDSLLEIAKPAKPKGVCCCVCSSNRGPESELGENRRSEGI